MKIVLKWNFKMLLGDIPRLILTLLSAAGTFTVLTAVGVTVESQMRILGSLNRGLPFFTLLILQGISLILFAFTLYLLFSISLEERRSPYALLRSAGATMRQTVWSLLAEAASLDLIGAAAGVGAGLLLAAGILRSNGLQLRADAMFSAAVLRGLLCALFLPPAMMLLSAPHLFRAPRERKRGRKPKKEKAPFPRRGVSGLFGFGGRLEHTLGRQQFRHRTRLTIVLMVNLAAVVLVTAGFSLIETAAERWQPVGDVELCYAYQTDTADGQAFHQAVRDTLRQCEEEGLARDVTYISDFGWSLLKLRLDDLDPLAAEAEQLPYDYVNGYPVLEPDLFHLADRDVLIKTAINVMDDASFARLLREYGIPYTEDSAVICDNCLYCSAPDAERYESATVGLFRSVPADGVTVYRFSSDVPAVYDLLNRYSAKGAQVFTLPGQTETLLAECPCVSLKIGGLLPMEFDRLFNFVQAIFSSGGTIFVPEHMMDRLSVLVNGNMREFVQLRSDNSGAVAERLRELDGQYGYSVSQSALGDGTYRYVYDPGSMTLIDHPGQSRQFFDYLRLLQNLYRVFVLLCFVMIVLNVVNVVHMNRVSRRREYAILSSVGISSAQRAGMVFYESFRICIRAVLFSVFLLIPAAYLGAYIIIGSLTYENLKIPDFDWIKNADTDGIFNNIVITAKALLLAVKPYLWLVILAVLVLFCGFVAAELLAGRRYEKEELIAVLKDDSYD